MAVFTFPKIKAFDTDGTLLSGGKVYFFASGTSTPKNSYPTRADAAALTNANANPLILDANGEGDAWPTTGKYKIRIDDSSDVTVMTAVDEIDGSDLTLGAGEDLTGSSTSDINMNSGAFTVAGATGNTVVGGTLQVDGVASINEDINMANTKEITWRDAANTTDVQCLDMDANDDLLVGDASSATLKTLILSAGSASGIAFKTNGSTQMNLTKGGDLGLGTTTPDAAIEIEGASTDTVTLHIDSGGHANIFIDGGGGSYNSGVRFQENGSTQYQAYYQSNTNEFVLYDTANSNQDLTINAGDFGFNTASPDAMLHMKGASTDTVTLHIDSGGHSNIFIDGGGGIYNSGVRFQEAGSTQYQMYYQSNANAFVLYDSANGAQDLTFLAGKLGLLGITSPTAALHVPASTTSVAPIRIPSGTAPTSPNGGDFWYDGTNLKFRDGGTTRTLTWT